MSGTRRVKNERRGRTGFAHLFEHMMFQGSEHHDAEYFGPLQEAGGRLTDRPTTTARTTESRTVELLELHCG